MCNSVSVRELRPPFSLSASLQCVLGLAHYRVQLNNVACLYVYWPGGKKTKQNRNPYELLMSVKCMLSLSLTHLRLSSFSLLTLFFCHLPYSCHVCVLVEVRPRRVLSIQTAKVDSHTLYALYDD